MIVNLIVIFLILILGFHFSRTKYKDSNKNRKAYIKIISFILILQSGLRNVAVGADTYSYFISFQNTINRSWVETYNLVLLYYTSGIGKDPGFMVLEKICSSIIADYQVFLFVIAIIFFSGLGNFLYKNTSKIQDIILAYVIYSVLFYSFFSITGHRQTIATGLVFFAFDLMKRKKIIFFVLLILLASTIHKSSLIFFLLFFVGKLKSSKAPFYISFVLFPIFFIIKSNLIGYIQNLIGYEEYEQVEGAGTYTFSAMFILISFVALIKQRNILKNNANMHYSYCAFALALMFLPLTWIHPSMMRVVQFFSIFMLLLVPEIIKSFRVYTIKVYNGVKTLAIVILILLFIKSNINAEPYGFFWENMRLLEGYYTTLK